MLLGSGGGAGNSGGRGDLDNGYDDEIPERNERPTGATSAADIRLEKGKAANLESPREEAESDKAAKPLTEEDIDEMVREWNAEHGWSYAKCPPPLPRDRIPPPAPRRAFAIPPPQPRVRFDPPMPAKRYQPKTKEELQALGIIPKLPTEPSPRASASPPPEGPSTPSTVDH